MILEGFVCWGFSSLLKYMYAKACLMLSKANKHTHTQTKHTTPQTNHKAHSKNLRDLNKKISSEIHRSSF